MASPARFRLLRLVTLQWPPLRRHPASNRPPHRRRQPLRRCSSHQCIQKGLRPLHGPSLVQSRARLRVRLARHRRVATNRHRRYHLRRRRSSSLDARPRRHCRRPRHPLSALDRVVPVWWCCHRRRRQRWQDGLRHLSSSAVAQPRRARQHARSRSARERHPRRRLASRLRRRLRRRRLRCSSTTVRLWAAHQSPSTRHSRPLSRLHPAVSSARLALSLSIAASSFAGCEATRRALRRRRPSVKPSPPTLPRVSHPCLLSAAARRWRLHLKRCRRPRSTLRNSSFTPTRRPRRPALCVALC